MVEYVTKQTVIDELSRYGMTEDGEAIINAIPAADVVEVRHGRWIKDDETGEPICSVCHSGKPTRAVCSSVIEHKLNNHEIRYCYYCGAKMDGGQDDA